MLIEKDTKKAKISKFGPPPGHPRWGGRQKGTLNKVTADVRVLAQQYAPQVIEVLVHIALKAENPQAQVAACKELLDRGFGKSTQPIDHGGQVQVNIVERLSGMLSRMGTTVTMNGNGHG